MDKTISNILKNNSIKRALLLLLVGVLGKLHYLVFTQENTSAAIILLSVLWLVSEIKRTYYIVLSDKHQTHKFKSWGEGFIAKYFDDKKIKYVYERPIKIKNQPLKPDFYLPEYDVFVEYWGGYNNQTYYEREYKPKKALYRQQKLEVVDIYPDNLVNKNRLDWVFTQRLLNIIKER